MRCYVFYWCAFVTVYVNWVLAYKSVILGTCNPDTVYLREQECEGPRLFLETKRGPRAKKKYGKDRL